LQSCNPVFLNNEVVAQFVIAKFCHPDEGRNTQETPQRNSAMLCRATCVPIFVEFLVCQSLSSYLCGPSFVRMTKLCDDKLKDKLKEGLL